MERDIYKAELCMKPERTNFRSLDKVFLFVAALLDRCTKQMKIVFMARVQTGYSETVIDMMLYMGQWTWNEKELSSLKRSVK